ncbi:MAG: long-chain acyl-CoA synthetase [Bermanella sp.]|jgi:long-chain acyl-CoA synthetase
MESSHNTIMDYMQRWLQECPDRVWLRDRKGDEFAEWTWQSAYDEFEAVAAWLEAQYGDNGTNIGLLSRNCAHWMLADMAILASGNVSIPLFTTQNAEISKYIVNFAEVKLLVLGRAENWQSIKAVLPADTQVLCLPGVEIDGDALRWEDIVAQYRGKQAQHQCRHDEIFTIPFTSGTTGMPKGVMQSHHSMIGPVERAASVFGVRDKPRLLSYLPLSHIAERQIIWVQSLVGCGTVNFNEDLSTLIRDMAATVPNMFFGAPRVWEMLHQGVVAKFGSQAVLDKMLADDREGAQALIKAGLGLSDYDFLLTAAAPIPASLIRWYDSLGIVLCEGFGQTEAMCLVVNTPDERRIGSIGKAVAGVEVKISDEGEMLCKADALSPGYYKQPDKTAETFVDGWVRTGDKVRIDEDGYVFITGRVKDYFKTLQGKFVAPSPIEDAFAASHDIEQLCLLGRGYSKTVMVCVLSPAAKAEDEATVSAALLAQAEAVNKELEKHARIGAVVVSREPWTIENGMLTPTLKLKRDQIEAKFGERAQQLAQASAEQRELMMAWC